MLDLSVRKAVLTGKPALQGPGIRLEVLPEGHLLHVMGAITANDLERHLSALGIKDTAVRPAGYRQWFVVGSERLSDALVRDLAGALAGSAFVSDQSHGRVRVGVSGPLAAELLSRGTAVDLHPSVFPEGRAAMTLFGHISVQVTRIAAHGFELTVLRSFAESLYEELEALALSLGASRISS
ncbi:sarcosine oxidase gamma subunit [Rhizobium freirei PRF 81]|uniref:Sarcosine oxidase gamma subunit n=1 Tax=Rhizobium freirei PRF 81 TaxID=363754 RepID=N6V2W2_9HYPH|nr:sarcosine oxidase subunit gamma family protein [Rhizobium freirei]ENN85432.1 sarcosine oxidase gamma subunit [Rhizobium freirei PRF 81]